MRRMYKARELVGISLKAISGKEAEFTEYNVSSLHLQWLTTIVFQISN